MTAARMLRYARRRAGLTQRALADKAGVPQPSIARIERGLTVPRLDTFQRLLRATGHGLQTNERLGEGVDRTLIREMLAMTPDQRGRSAARAGRRLAAMLEKARVDGRAVHN